MTTKKIEKNCKKIIKKTNKFSKKHPTQAVAIGGTVLAVATSAVTSCAIRGSRKLISRVLNKQLETSNVPQQETSEVPAVVNQQETAEVPAVVNQQPEANQEAQQN